MEKYWKQQWHIYERRNIINKHRKRKRELLSKRWRDERHTQTHGSFTQTIQQSQMSFSIRREYMYVKTRYIQCHLYRVFTYIYWLRMWLLKCFSGASMCVCAFHPEISSFFLVNVPSFFSYVSCGLLWIINQFY
jgi:hypothetical protein